jgi:hypothetical protein
MIFWTYSLYIGNRLPYKESAENALSGRKKERKFQPAEKDVIFFFFF